MYDYMADCVPFMQKLSAETSDKHTIDTIFGANGKKGAKFCCCTTKRALQISPQVSKERRFFTSI